MDLEPLVERRGDPQKHLERVPLVVRVFEPRDHGVGSSDHLGKSLLREPRLGSECVDLLGDLRVKHRLFERPEPIRSSPDEEAVQDFEPIRGGSTLGHRVSGYVWPGGSASKACLRQRARSISARGTAASCLAKPCEITTACCPWKKYSIRYCTRPAFVRNS